MIRDIKQSDLKLINYGLKELNQPLLKEIKSNYLMYVFNNYKKGFINYTLSYEIMDIDGIYIFPNERKKGYAYSMMLEFFEFARSKGAKKIMLEVRESNTPALNLYKKLGFKILCKRKNYYKTRLLKEDAFVMEKNLQGRKNKNG